MMYYTMFWFICQPLNTVMLPIRYKPEHKYIFTDHVREIPNVLDDYQIARLRQALWDNAGLHRRGSKDPGVNASFYTCLLGHLGDELYPMLNYIWEENKNIIFIEPYEIKLYVEGDVFSWHRDGYVNLDENVSRTMNLIIQLSDESEYDGGELVIGDHRCTKNKGSAIIFPAILPHEVTEITRGERYSLIGHGWSKYQHIGMPGQLSPQESPG